MNKRILVGVIILCVFCTYAIYLLGRSLFGPSPVISVFPNTIEPTTAPTPTPDPLAPFTVVLLGYAGGKHEGSLLTDTIIAAHIHPKNGTIALISIPRDLSIPLPVKTNEQVRHKINAAFAIGYDHRAYPDKPEEFLDEHGGGKMAKRAIETVLGLPVRNYIAINFNGFQSAIDTLGGVDIRIPRMFEDPWYPIEGMEKDSCGTLDEEIQARVATMSGDLLNHSFPCRYELLRFESGNIHLDGQAALKFVRSRHSPTEGSDYARSTRQRLLLTAIKDKIFTLSFLPKAPSFIQTLSGSILTDIQLESLQTLASDGTNPTNYKTYSLALTEDNVLVASRSADEQYVLVPKTGTDDWKSIHAYLDSNLTASAAAALTKQ